MPETSFLVVSEKKKPKILLRRAAAYAITMTASLSISLRASSDCSLQLAFDQPDGRRLIHVYKGVAEPGSGNVEPLLFISSLKVNTDGTRISYKVDDPRAQHGAINDIRNALRQNATIEQFQAAAARNWEPVDDTWKILPGATSG